MSGGCFSNTDARRRRRNSSVLSDDTVASYLDALSTPTGTPRSEGVSFYDQHDDSLVARTSEAELVYQLEILDNYLTKLATTSYCVTTMQVKLAAKQKELLTCVKNFKSQVSCLRSNHASNQELSTIVTKTNELLDGFMSSKDMLKTPKERSEFYNKDLNPKIKSYKKLAKKQKGKPSTGWRILGGIMLGLGVAVAAVGVVATVVSLGLATPVTSVMIGGGVVLAAAGVTAVAKGRRKGLSRSALALANATHKACEIAVKSKGI